MCAMCIDFSIYIYLYTYTHTRYIMRSVTSARGTDSSPLNVADSSSSVAVPVRLCRAGMDARGCDRRWPAEKNRSVSGRSRKLGKGREPVGVPSWFAHPTVADGGSHGK